MWTNGWCWLHEYTNWWINWYIALFTRKYWKNVQILKQCTNSQTMQKYTNSLDWQFLLNTRIKQLINWYFLWFNSIQDCLHLASNNLTVIIFWVIRTFLIIILFNKIMLNQDMINYIYYLYVLRSNIQTGIVVNLYSSSNQKVKIVSLIVLTSSSSDNTNFEPESTTEATQTSNPTHQFQQHCEYSFYVIIGRVIIPCFFDVK